MPDDKFQSRISRSHVRRPGSPGAVRRSETIGDEGTSSAFPWRESSPFDRGILWVAAFQVQPLTRIRGDRPSMVGRTNVWESVHTHEGSRRSSHSERALERLVEMRVFRSDAKSVGSWTTRTRWRKEGRIGISRCSLSAFPDFLPSCVRDLEEDHAVTMAKDMRRVDVHVDGCRIPSSFVPPIESGEKERKPLVMLHGFDSSCMEFRRLRPRLMERGIEAWAVDLLGWGFTDPSSCIYGSVEGSEGVDLLGCGPETKTKHLHAFWEQQLDSRPMVLLGASLGGAAALHFALEHPEAVEALVLVDAQGFIEGIGPMSSLPTPIARLGLQVLKSVPLRDAANRMAYHDKEKFATQEARDIGRLHCLLPHWEDASLSFMQSGGYKVQRRIELVEQNTLVLWGEQDKILEPDYAFQFESTLPNARIQWIKESGHVPHLEQPDATAIAIEEFLNSL